VPTEKLVLFASETRGGLISEHIPQVLTRSSGQAREYAVHCAPHHPSEAALRTTHTLGCGGVWSWNCLRLLRLAASDLLAGGWSCLLGIRSIFSPPPLQSGLLCPCSSSALCAGSTDDASAGSPESEQPSPVCGRPDVVVAAHVTKERESARSRSGRQPTKVGPETEQTNSSGENPAVRLGIRVSFYGYEAKRKRQRMY
jgi:hypothetical protein